MKRSKAASEIRTHRTLILANQWIKLMRQDLNERPRRNRTKSQIKDIEKQLIKFR